MRGPVGSALVTGGNGYFGSLLVRQLRQQGWLVRVLDLVDAEDRSADVEFIRGDIRDARAVAQAVEGVEAVFHNVAQVPLTRDRALFESVNVHGTNTLLTACESARVGKVVYTSSSAVFGVPASNPVTAQAQPRPAESYGLAKYRGELLCRAAASRGLDVSIIRPRTIVGPGRLGIFGILFDWIADGVAVPVLGRGDNRYQFVHAHDLAVACILAAQRPGPATYNIGAEEFASMRETLEALCDYAATGSRVISLPVRLATGTMELTGRLHLTPFGPYHWLMYSRALWFDVTAAKQELGWSAAYSTDAAFRDAYDWFIAHRADLPGQGASVHRSPARQGALAGVKWFLGHAGLPG